MNEFKLDHPPDTGAPTNSAFYLLGGASLLTWIACVFLQAFRTQSWAANHHLEEFAATFSFLALVVNYPHFMISYRFAYGRGWGIVRRHPWALLGVPVALTVCFALTYMEMKASSSHWTLIQWINGAFLRVGWMPPIQSTENAGVSYLALLVQFMYLTVGWHYAKQIFGCVLAACRKAGCELRREQRRALHWSVHGVWIANYLGTNSSSIPGGPGPTFFGLQLPSVYFPGELRLASIALCVGLSTHFLVQVLPRIRSSWALLVPWIAFHVWWLTPFRQLEFYLYAVPFFHSLQYLYFAWGREAKFGSKRPWIVALACVVGGFVFFEWLPSTLDSKLRTDLRLQIPFVFIAAQVFLNVHHYFIDSVVWRSDDPHFAPEARA